MTDTTKPTFDELADRRPPHDPATCTREPCGRCHPKGGVAKPPKVKANPHDVAPPTRPLPPLAATPAALAAELDAMATAATAAAKALRSDGPRTWSRFADWEPISRIPTFAGQPDDDEDEANAVHGEAKRPPRSAEDERDRMLDAQAGRYWAELGEIVARTDRAARRITADSNRLASLVDIANLPNTKGVVHNAQGCEFCTRAGVKKDGKPVPYEHTSNVGERLAQDTKMCTPHYKFVWDKGRAPTDEETRHWDDTGSWKVKAHA